MTPEEQQTAADNALVEKLVREDRPPFYDQGMGAFIHYYRNPDGPEAAERIKSLQAENFMLAAGVCIYPNGEGLFGDDHGNSFCSVEVERKRLDERETELMAQLIEAEADRQRMREALEKVQRVTKHYPGDDYDDALLALTISHRTTTEALNPASKEANDG